MPEKDPPTVLVIDDDALVAETLASVLNISGFKATAVFSGERALELARENSFDHLVADVVMGGMSGIETAVAVRQILPACRIHLISGNLNTSELLTAARAQGHDFEVRGSPSTRPICLRGCEAALCRPTRHPPRQVE
ncbi:MAG TPA: response regulator [Terracidiphilus sp.]|nr:response regulator [Terracidiphilus sp.]